jgi:hypothetical protein
VLFTHTANAPLCCVIVVFCRWAPLRPHRPPSFRPTFRIPLSKTWMTALCSPSPGDVVPSGALAPATRSSLNTCSWSTLAPPSFLYHHYWPLPMHPSFVYHPRIHSPAVPHNNNNIIYILYTENTHTPQLPCRQPHHAPSARTRRNTHTSREETERTHIVRGACATARTRSSTPSQRIPSAKRRVLQHRRQQAHLHPAR